MNKLNKWKDFNVRVIAHIAIVLNIFLLTRLVVTHFELHDNWIFFSYLFSLVASLGKEVYDEMSEDGSGFDYHTLIKEIAIPTVWMFIYYIAYM